MDSNKKYELSERERDISMLICLAASGVSEAQGCNEKKRTEYEMFAADITARIKEHLDGKKPFKQEAIAFFRLVDKLLFDPCDGLISVFTGRGHTDSNNIRGEKEDGGNKF